MQFDLDIRGITDAGDVVTLDAEGISEGLIAAAWDRVRRYPEHAACKRFTEQVAGLLAAEQSRWLKAAQRADAERAAATRELLATVQKAAEALKARESRIARCEAYWSSQRVAVKEAHRGPDGRIRFVADGSRTRLEISEECAPAQ